MHTYTCSNAECGKVFEVSRRSASRRPCCSRKCSAHLTTMAEHKRTLTGDSVVRYLKESGESYSRHELARYYRVDTANMQSVLDDLQESGRIKCAANKQKTLYYVQPDRVMYERYEPEFRPMRGMKPRCAGRLMRWSRADRGGRYDGAGNQRIVHHGIRAWLAGVDSLDSLDRQR